MATSIEDLVHQKSKLYELRAATSLGRLWHSQGKSQEAHDLIISIYEWFNEGFDTADLKNTKAFLAEISGNSGLGRQ